MSHQDPMGYEPLSLDEEGLASADKQDEQQMCSSPPVAISTIQNMAVVMTAGCLLPFCVFAALTKTGSTTSIKLSILLISAAVLWTSWRAMRVESEIPTQAAYNPSRRTWFGHRMSYEGACGNIPVVICATLSFVIGYGAIVSLLAPGGSTHVLCIPAFYGAGLLVFYGWHVAAHTCESTALHRMHMQHHQDEHPQEDFYGDSNSEVQRKRAARGGTAATLCELMNPSENSTNSLEHEGPLLIGTILTLIFARIIFQVSVSVLFFAFIGYTFMALFGGAIHISFHERNFELECYAWYRELRSLHMIHHMHRKNYAMVNIELDRLFGSLMMNEAESSQV